MEGEGLWGDGGAQRGGAEQRREGAQAVCRGVQGAGDAEEVLRARGDGRGPAGAQTVAFSGELEGDGGGLLFFG